MLPVRVPVMHTDPGLSPGRPAVPGIAAGVRATLSHD